MSNTELTAIVDGVISVVVLIGIFTLKYKGKL